jgi:hypothetical protein
MIKIFRESVFPESTHQHGWNEVLRLMRTHLHQQTGAPAFLDDFVDISFGDNRTDPGIPYKHPWVGIVHHPVDIQGASPNLHLKSASVMMRTPQFRESVKCCKGLVTFSPSNATRLKGVLRSIDAEVPVKALAHPTAQNVSEFSVKRFEKHRQINCVGFWLRRLQTFAHLHTDLKKRYIFMSHRGPERMAHLLTCCDDKIPSDCEVIPYLDFDSYNYALSSGIGFADYYACVASNTILEHIARATPLLVNPLPSIVDYLGKEYPFYFQDMREAEDKLRNVDLIRQTHEYLKAPKFTAMLCYARFINTIKSILTEFLK